MLQSAAVAPVFNRARARKSTGAVIDRWFRRP
jgi:hypothetical protein